MSRDVKDADIASKQASLDTVISSRPVSRSSNKKPSDNDISGGSFYTQKLIKSKSRVKEFGEVFTPENIVKQMCDLCEPDISAIDKKIFEPTCGNGNFLVEILRRKLSKIKFKSQKQFEAEIILALSNIYAVDIQEDNVKEARARLADIVDKFVSLQIEKGKYKHRSYEFINVVESILDHTIIIGNTLTQKKKIKFYDLKLLPNKNNSKNYEFEISQYSLEEIEHSYQKIRRTDIKNLENTISSYSNSPPLVKTVKPRLKLKHKNLMQGKLF